MIAHALPDGGYIIVLRGSPPQEVAHASTRLLHATRQEPQTFDGITLSFHSRVMGNGASVSGAGAAFQNALFFWPALGNCAVYFRPTIHHGGS
jgi:hypothetical protein